MNLSRKQFSPNRAASKKRVPLSLIPHGGALAALILALLVAAAGGQQAPKTPRWIKARATGVGDVAASGATLVVIVQNKALMSSTDGGRSFHSYGRSGVNRISINADGLIYIVDENGNVWFRTKDGEDWIKTEASGMNDVAVGPDGKVACTASADGAVWLSVDGRTFAKERSSDCLRVAFDLNGLLWATDKDGSLWLFNRGRRKKTNGDHLSDVAVDSQGTVWLTRQDGTVTVTKQGVEFVELPMKAPVGFENISLGSTAIAWATGRDGTLWSINFQTPASEPGPDPVASAPAPAPAAPAKPSPAPPVPDPASPQKPKQKQKILNQVVTREYPTVRFRFGTTVAVAPVVYLSERAIDAFRINPRFIAASKVGPVGTSHDIRIALPKGDKVYHFVVIADGQPLWVDTVVHSSPKTY